MALTDTLTAFWKLDETSGTRNDTIGTQHLTDVNTVGSDGGKKGRSAVFVSFASEYLNIADNATLSTGDIDFTVAFWTRLTTKVATMRLGKWQTGQLEYNIAYTVTDDRFRFEVSNNGTAIVSVVANNFGSPPVDQWCYIVAWHDATANTINITVNDGTANSTAHTTGVNNGTAPFRIGASGDGDAYWNGKIDEFGFWKRVLTAGERTSLYAGGTGLTHPFTDFGARYFTKESYLYVPQVHNPAWLFVPSI